MQVDDNPTDTASRRIEDNRRLQTSLEEARNRKVFFLLDSLKVGGTERQALELALGLDPTRYRVTLGCLRAQGPLGGRLQDSPVEVREFYPQGGVDSVRGIYQLTRLAMFLRRRRFDIFHSHDLWSNLMGVPAAWLARVPVIISSRRDLGHLDWYSTRKRSWLRRIQRLSDLVVTNADAIRDRLIEDEGLPAAKVRTIRNGVDFAAFAEVYSQRDKLFPMEGNSKLIVLVGNMHSDVKGHPWLIKAVPEILREFPQASVAFVGEGAQRKAFEQQAAALGCAANFLFLGSRADVPQILACCDIAVLPSKAEGLSNALLEYMAAGLPVVATGVGGNVEVVVDGETGLLVPPQDERALAVAIIRYLRDPGLALRMAKCGQEHVHKHFSDEQMIRSTDKLYSELLAHREEQRTA